MGEITVRILYKAALHRKRPDKRGSRDLPRSPLIMASAPCKAHPWIVGILVALCLPMSVFAQSNSTTSSTSNDLMTPVSVAILVLVILIFVFLLVFMFAGLMFIKKRNSC